MTEARAVRVLVAGVTTRALAISAARAGYRVTAVDAFGDLDLRALVQVISVPGRLGARFVPFAAEAGAQVPAEIVAYTSNFENHPGAVARLAEGRRLLGNPPEVLTRVRNPIELMRLLRRHGFARPESRATAPAKAGVRSWLLKPRRSGGGHGIAIWKAGAPVPKSSYLQERIVGHPGSVIFAADGRRAVLLGFSRQLVADTSFGAHRFRYCGSLLGTPLKPLFPRQTELLERAKALATVLSREFQLVGLNGIDFIARKGVPYPIEVNPRYSASMELIERGQAVSMFETHAAACLGVLPPVPRPGEMVEGKAIVFARHDVVLGDTRPWLSDAWLADVPHPGERIPRGRPICTVFARARDGEACRRLLIRRAAAVYRFVGSRRSRAA